MYTMDDVAKEIEGGGELVGSVNAGGPLARERWDSRLLQVDADRRELDELAADVQPPDPCRHAFIYISKQPARSISSSISISLITFILLTRRIRILIN
jgi:hypothetical protein